VRSDYAALLLASLLAWVISLRRSGVYASHRAERLVTVTLAYLRALVWAGLTTAAVVFALKLAPISRLFFVYYFVFGFVFLTLKQAVVIAVLRRLRQRGYNLRHALVVGAGKPAGWFARVYWRLGTQGTARRSGAPATGGISETSPVPVVGTLQDIDAVLDRYEVDEASWWAVPAS
jgi:FlaA1/EpsC-like NDP-sugar epimerase